MQPVIKFAIGRKATAKKTVRKGKYAAMFRVANQSLHHDFLLRATKRRCPQGTSFGS